MSLSLARIGDELVGDPLDVKMFEATGWEYLDESFSDQKVDRSFLSSSYYYIIIGSIYVYHNILLIFFYIL